MNNADEFFLPLRVPDHSKLERSLDSTYKLAETYYPADSAVALSVIMLQQAVTDLVNNKRSEANDSPNREKTEDLAFFLTVFEFNDARAFSKRNDRPLFTDELVGCETSSAQSNVALLWITADELFRGCEQPEDAACACAFTVHGLPHLRGLLAAHVCLEVLRLARISYGPFSVVRIGWNITRDRATIIIVGDESFTETYSAFEPEGEPYDATPGRNIAWYQGMPVCLFGTPPYGDPSLAELDETFEDVK
ncbi:hypothetical protein CVT26_005801 [Gymnopilus dilepis]|uniref:Uncharacterized protein n=1 Tax=Gymnopilus dilepis TaxID=231916 RepID=A0A409YL29_9AGAR|nr:hypothetical protein CVT26_005801 [Gymnopilus dilepis]